MRNIFDQYSQPENRVTHALMTALDQDRRLLGEFLRTLVKVKAPAEPYKLSLLEQQYPGEEEPSDDDLEQRRGIPDGWIFDEERWCVLIESKVIARLEVDQLRRHRHTAERRDFRDITVVAITVIVPPALPPDTILLEWRKVYVWLRRHGATSEWAARTADYLEIAETKLIEARQLTEGALTMFSGFPFVGDHKFSYFEGKRVLRLALEELRAVPELVNDLGINKKAPGRPAITGRESEAVWDFLSLGPASDSDTFTKYPHLTLGVGSQAVDAMVTVPNAVNSAMRRNLTSLGETGFQELARKVVTNLEPLLRDHEGTAPWFRGVQRRYLTQRSVPFVDARIEFDLRTAIPASGPPKTQPLWLSAAYGAFVNKESSNYQIQMGALFRYERCTGLRQADTAIKLISNAWLACKPLVDLGR